MFEILEKFWSIDCIILQIFSYQMSYLEFIGTVLNLCSVIFMAQRRISGWPIGIVGAILFAGLFFQLQLYADFFEQFYFIGSSIYGWILWAKAPGGTTLPTVPSPPTAMLRDLTITLLLGAALAYGMLHIHLFLPIIFQQPASLPWLDSLTTVASFTAMILMAKGRLEAWVYWMIIDTISVVLYAYKGIHFVALLYVVYLGLAFLGLREWSRAASVMETTKQ